MSTNRFVAVVDLITTAQIRTEVQERFTVQAPARVLRKINGKLTLHDTVMKTRSQTYNTLLQKESSRMWQNQAESHPNFKKNQLCVQGR